jgi:hypothetical protein
MASSNNLGILPNGRRFAPVLLLLAVTAAFGVAQNLPSKIRGYKVYKKAVSVTAANGPTGSLKISTPSVEDVSFSGVKVAVTVGIDGVSETGRVDFLTFHDFKVNDIPVTIDEYNEPFRFQKGQTVSLPKPLGINVGAVELLDAARKGTDAFRSEWTITGRVLVFGKFKKYGMQFRRVVPIDIDLKIKNPFTTG